MAPPSRPLLPLFLLTLLLTSECTFEGNFSFDFTSFSLRNLTLLGDSYLRNGTVGLTRESGVPCSSSGTAIYNNPIRFFDPRSTNLSASFSTRFSFSVTNASPESTGDGIAFFVSPRGDVIGGTGGFLGLFNSSAEEDEVGSIIAVEFDTRMDSVFGDLNANHVGFDVDGPESLNSTALEPLGIDLKSGNPVTAWVDYDDDKNMVMVWVGYTNVKPEKPVMSVSYDLSRHLAEYMYVGFSASTEGSTVAHTLLSWSFEIFELRSVSISPSPNSSNGSRSVVIPATVGSKSESTFRKRLGLGVGIACPVLFFALFVLLALWFFIKARLIVNEGGRGGFDRSDILKGPRKFSYKELSVATRGFHSSRIVGNGAFGNVYRAAQPETGKAYAVKRSKRCRQGKSEFLAELSIIAGLRHKNLIQLQGWCDERGELLLVYEFMPNGSLDKVLHQGGQEEWRGPSTLGWRQRCNVATGIASVLAYLHQECEQQVIHRDIKASNIMLDANLNPRLGDFGLARLTDHDKSPLSTLTAGTIGYLAPEYLQYGKATEKTDVFSFGVVLLEVCCGRRPIDKAGGDGSEDMVNLVDWVWRLHAVDRLLDAADARLNGGFDGEEMRRMLLVGLSCANPDCNARPSMRRVLQILEREVEPMQVPRIKPCLTFTCGLPLSLDDIIVSEGDETDASSSSSNQRATTGFAQTVLATAMGLDEGAS